uniref:Uncharacterized protein n=1 Tax=Arundo donax TaxID=35708 RepID=A0A0A9GK33_ARUDO
MSPKYPRIYRWCLSWWYKLLHPVIRCIFCFYFGEVSCQSIAGPTI